MKKIMVFTAALMFMFTTMAFAGGDQNCGDKAQGSAGSSGQGEVRQNRAPSN